MKKLFHLVLCVGLIFLLCIPANASTRDARLMEYDHINTVTANITIDGFWGIASCDGSVTASNDYPVYVQVSLQKKTENGWETLKTWSSEGQYHASASGSRAVARGYQYRTCTIGYVYDDNGTIIDSASAIYGITYD